MSEAQRWAEGFGISIPAYLKCRHRGVSESQVLEGLELAYERRHEHPMRTYKDVVGWAYAYARELEGNKLSTAQETVKEIESKINLFAKNYADFQDNIDKLEKKLQKKVWVNRLMTAYGALATLFIGFLTYYLLWFPKG